jgi:hypothetical protein
MTDELDIANNINSEIPFDTTKKGLFCESLIKAMILNGLGYVNKQLYLPPLYFLKTSPWKLSSYYSRNFRVKLPQALWVGIKWGNWCAMGDIKIFLVPYLH